MGLFNELLTNVGSPLHRRQVAIANPGALQAGSRDLVPLAAFVGQNRGQDFTVKPLSV